MAQPPKEGKPVCPKCERKTIYFRKDGSVRCTACGYEGLVGKP